MEENQNELLNQKYEELSFMNLGDMLLINPKENPIEDPVFFIKENNMNIRKMVSENKSVSFEFKQVTYNISGVRPMLLMIRMNKNNNLVYGQWINNFNKTDRKNIIDINFKEKINFCIIDADNRPRIHFKCDNTYKSKLGKYLKHEAYSPKWSNEMFENEVIYINDNFNSKDELFNFD